MEPLSLIVAVDMDGGFGKGGKIPWHFPEDLKHFKEVTADSICIMGRHTYTDMLEMIQARNKKNKKPNDFEDILPGRTSFVVTSDPHFSAPGATVVPSIRNAIESIDAEKDQREIFVIGGEKMYTQALSWATTVYMTVVKEQSYECDRFFPVEVLNKHFSLAYGTESEDLYFAQYQRNQ
jgi:dihydrofolate reductase